MSLLSARSLGLWSRRVPGWSKWTLSPSVRPWHASAVLGEGRKANLRARKSKERAKKSSMYEKFIGAKEKKLSLPLHELWPTMSIRDVARVLNQPVDNIFDLVLGMPNVDFLENDRQPINEVRILKELSKIMKFRLQLIRDPNQTVAAEVEADLDVVPVPIDRAKLRPRAPVVAIMGHVDHGKTTLLDHLRHSRVVESEFGGITQHIGAFSVELKSEAVGKTRHAHLWQRVTFIDTPGHAAFKAMRSRGANVTDIVVLVVDASEGVLEQTRESIRMIKEAGTPMVVAINKIDRPRADVEATQKALAEAGVQVEALGGSVPSVPISALKGTNVDQLIRVLVQQAEALDLQVEYEGQIEGKVIESEVDRGLGRTATILITRGTLQKRDHLVCGTSVARVKVLLDDQGQSVDRAVPSQAVRVSGWKTLPPVGDHVYSVESDKRAREVVTWREKQEKKVKELLDLDSIEKTRDVDRENYQEYRMKRLKAGVFKPRFMRHDFKVRTKETEEYDGVPKVSFVIKADVDGSLEAILNLLDTYDDTDVILDILDFGVGEVTENDIVLAKQFNGFIMAFNAPKITPARLKTAVDNGVEIMEHNIIYRLVEDLKREIGDKLPLIEDETVLGRGRVQKEFLINVKRRKFPVAGCKISSGKVLRESRIKVLRDKDVVYEGGLSSLKHLKDEVNEVPQGRECGLMLDDPEVRFQAGDEVLCYSAKLVPQECTWNPGF